MAKVDKNTCVGQAIDGVSKVLLGAGGSTALGFLGGFAYSRFRPEDKGLDAMGGAIFAGSLYGVYKMTDAVCNAFHKYCMKSIDVGTPTKILKNLALFGVSGASAFYITKLASQYLGVGSYYINQDDATLATASGLVGMVGLSGYSNFDTIRAKTQEKAGVALQVTTQAIMAAPTKVRETFIKKVEGENELKAKLIYVNAHIAGLTGRKDCLGGALKAMETLQNDLNPVPNTEQPAKKKVKEKEPAPAGEPSDPTKKPVEKAVQLLHPDTKYCIDTAAKMNNEIGRLDKEIARLNKDKERMEKLQNEILAKKPKTEESAQAAGSCVLF